MDEEALRRAQEGELRLVGQARAGDEMAWEAIIRQHFEGVWSLSRRIVRDQQGAEEVTQETFRVVKEKLWEYRGPGALCGWIHAICRRQALDQLRRRARLAREVSIEGWPEESVNRAQTGEERWIEHIDLDRALASLEQEEREALLLTEAGYTSDELAKTLGVAPTTIRSRRARARARLLRELGAGYSRRHQ
jgi:RNA polymerase sigma-70 factor, ECF subfamily